ncbi:MAG: FAD-dependent oxidoreductase [Bacteroidales bacterium]
MNENYYDLIILGAGPAGLAAGIYASRGKLRTLILNEGATGGQVTLTNEIANYPGVETTTGYSLVNTMKNQAKSFGCRIKSNLSVTGLDLTGPVKRVTVNGRDTYEAKALILTPGGKPRMLGIPGEAEYKGGGVSYCATCDGDFFTGKHVIVVGGGNSALEEAVALTNHARRVTIVHQFDHFQAFEHAVEEVRKNEKIEIILESEPREIFGDSTVKGMRIEHLPTGKMSEIEADGVFIFIGYVPNTESFKGVVKMNDRDEMIVSPSMETDIEGVYAAGDAIVKRYRQVTTAVSDGTIAALAATEFIRSHK